MRSAIIRLTQACKVLLDAGCDLDAKASSGGTALMFAAAAGYTDVVKLLLQKGADVNATVKVTIIITSSHHHTITSSPCVVTSDDHYTIIPLYHYMIVSVSHPTVQGTGTGTYCSGAKYQNVVMLSTSLYKRGMIYTLLVLCRIHTCTVPSGTM